MIVAKCHIHSFTYDFHLRMISRYLIHKEVHRLIIQSIFLSDHVPQWLQHEYLPHRLPQILRLPTAECPELCLRGEDCLPSAQKCRPCQGVGMFPRKELRGEVLLESAAYQGESGLFEGEDAV